MQQLHFYCSEKVISKTAFLIFTDLLPFYMQSIREFVCPPTLCIGVQKENTVGIGVILYAHVERVNSVEIGIWLKHKQHVKYGLILPFFFIFFVS